MFTCICDEFTGEDGEITVTHIVLGIWSVKESAGHIIMSTLGFDDEKAKELAKFVSSKIDLLLLVPQWDSLHPFLVCRWTRTVS